MARHPIGLGTHTRRDHGVVGCTADLSTGRTLQHALRLLDGRVGKGWIKYADAWVKEMEDIDCTIRAHCRRDGEWGLCAYLPADGQEQERNRRYKALVAHLDDHDGTREAVVKYQRLWGRWSDDRDVSTRDLFEALRPYLSTKGAILVDPQGHLSIRSNDAGKVFFDSEPARIAAMQMSEIFQRWRSWRPLERIVRRLGQQTGNGWIVLEARA